MIKQFNYIALFIVFIFTSSFNPVDDIVLRKIIEQFNSYSNTFYLQKVFVHTDKENYIVNENIWFKTYVLNGHTHKLDSIKRNIYVELINSNSEITQVRLLKINGGVANGYFYLPDSLASGNYQIRAFTNLMKNFNRDYLFTKTIYIFNEKNFEISREQYRIFKKMKRHKDFINITYYPQNESVICGVKNKISIKTVNYVGIGIKSKGYIIDNKKKIIEEFETDSEGNSFFYFTPLSDEKYKLIIVSEKGKKKKFKLPEIKKNGSKLIISKNNNKIEIQVFANLKKNNDRQAKKFYIVAQARGKIFYTFSGTFEKLENQQIEDRFYNSWNIDKNIFPTGIVQFSLFNGFGKLQSEGLIFVNNNDNFKIEVLEKKIKDNYIELKIRTLDNKGNLMPANLSISINSEKEADSQTNIEREVLLNSDLKNKTKKTNIEYDSINYLVNSNNWDKYSWENILKKQQDTLLYKKENSITISGYITKTYMGLPAEKSEVILSILSTFNDSYTTRTDKKGKFAFKNLDYKDTIDILLEARNQQGRKFVLVYKNNYDTIPIYFNSVKDMNNRQYQLKNINNEEKKRITQRSSLHGQADQIIYFDEIETAGYTDVFEVLKSRVPGMQVSGNTTRLRGYSSINQSSEPLYLINDVPVGRGAVSSMNVDDVERVEIIKSSAKNAIYGSRGGNGVIAVYTKNGHNIIRGRLQTYQLGYHRNKKFYFSEIEYPQNYYPAYFWLPETRTNKDGFVTVRFQLPENTSSYKINIQGVSENGTVGFFNMLIKGRL